MTKSISNYVLLHVAADLVQSILPIDTHAINVEKGIGYVGSEADYEASLSTGMIPPPIPIATRVAWAKIASTIKAPSLSSASTVLSCAKSKEKIRICLI